MNLGEMNPETAHLIVAGFVPFNTMPNTWSNLTTYTMPSDVIPVQRRVRRQPAWC